MTLEDMAMDEAFGTIIFFGVMGLILGDEVGKKVSVYLTLLGIVAILMFSHINVVGMFLAPIAVVLILLGGLIGFLRSL
jgi:hypothetical protein